MAKSIFISGKSGNFALQSVDMTSLETFKIDLKALSEGETTIECGLGDDFFEDIDAPDVRSGQLHIVVTIRRRDNTFELLFHTAGTVTVPCDLCLDDMEQSIEATDRLTAYLGETDSEGDDTVSVSEEEGILDVAWFVYESIALNIPLRHVHAPGKCNPAMMKVLKEHSAARSGDEDGENVVDSRWAALKDLKITN